MMQSYNNIQSAYGQDKLKGPSSGKPGSSIPSYSKENYDNIQSSYGQGNISEDEEEEGEMKIAYGLDGIKESYNDIKSVYAQDANISPLRKE